MSLRPSHLAGAAAALIAAVTTPALAQTNSFVQGTVYDAPALTTFTTDSEKMIGMRVTWTFDDNTTGTANWTGFGPDAFGVNVGGFRVQRERFADTFFMPWSVINNSGKGITSVRFNGQPGRVVFDCGWTSTGCAANQDPQQQMGSPNSARGWSLSTLGFGGANVYTGGVVGQYANLVGLVGAAPVGDLFEQLTISFSDVLASGQIYGFRADTDNTSGDIPVPPPVVPPPTVPEPATWSLLVAGLGVVVVTQRRRRTMAA
jgi:hypothetical protein